MIGAKYQVIVIMLNRDSLEIPRREHEREDQELIGAPQGIPLNNNAYSECSPAADRSAACCRSLALTVRSIYY